MRVLVNRELVMSTDALTMFLQGFSSTCASCMIGYDFLIYTVYSFMIYKSEIIMQS